MVGGGSTGSSILYNLAKRGSPSPLLIERGPGIASGQTSRSTALVRTHYTVPVVAKMALLSYRFFRDFGSLLPGFTSGYSETGLLIGVDGRSESLVAESLKMFRQMGIRSDFVDKRAERGLDRRPEPGDDAVEIAQVEAAPPQLRLDPAAEFCPQFRSREISRLEHPVDEGADMDTAGHIGQEKGDVA